MSDQNTPVEATEGSGYAAPTAEAAPVDDNDFPLGKACDLSGEGTCEACQ